MSNPSIVRLRPPKFLLGATLLFWGLMTGQWMVAVPFACMIEAASRSTRRFSFDPQDLRRAGQLATLLLLASVITAFNTNEGVEGMRVLMQPGVFANQSEALLRMTQTILGFFQSLPIVFYPVAWIATWDASNNQDWRHLIWFRSVRPLASTHRASAVSASATPLGFNPLYAYFLVSIVASGATLAPGPWFLCGLIFLGAWMVFPQKTARYTTRVWIANGAIVCLLTTSAVFGYKVAEKKANELYLRWIRALAQEGSDFKEARTAIGSIGKIKSSGRVLFRVQGGAQTPPLLREASFTTFQNQSWHAMRRIGSPVSPDQDGSGWTLRPGIPATNEVVISKKLKSRKGILPLPTGVTGLRHLPVGSLATNRLGVAQVDEAPGFVSYAATFGEKGGIDSPPDPDDLVIPAVERPALEEFIARLDLTNLPGGQKIRRVDKFFLDHFRYSLYLEPLRPISGAAPSTPLADFLRRSRSGHCEYFATATVLLLRQAGIPARYAVGYSIQERTGDEYWIRDRHTHAWCLAFLDGRWRDLDTTPASWLHAESSRAGWWEPFLDAFSSASYHFSKWRWSQTNLRQYLTGSVWVLFALTLGLFLLKRRSSTGASSSKRALGASSSPGTDSEFYEIEARLAWVAGHRIESTPLAQWIRDATRGSGSEDGPLREALELHYRYRFDPQGISPEERSKLRETARCWLVAHPENGSS